MGKVITTIKSDPQKMAKWQRWRKQIESDLIHLLGSRQIYKSYGDMVRENKPVLDNGALFHNWIVDNYVTFVAMAIRRQADTDTDSISLARLIEDIRDNPETLSKEWHSALYKNFIIEGYGDQMFEENAGTGSIFDPAIAVQDLAELHKVSRQVNLLASRSIAHKSTRAVPKLTFDDIDGCIKAIKSITRKYILLLTAGDNVLEPIMDEWQGAFTVAWIKESDNETRP